MCPIIWGPVNELFLTNIKESHIKTIAQAKVYNLMLMENSFLTLWKYEGSSFKYFKNKSKIKITNGSEKSINRINLLIEDKAKLLMDQINMKSKVQEDKGKKSIITKVVNLFKNIYKKYGLFNKKK